MSDLLQAAELDEIRQRRERLPICEMVEDNEACRIILAPYASNTGSTATFLREVRDDIPRLLAHIEALTPVVEAAEQWDRASQDMFDHIHGWCTEECSEDETDSFCARGQQLVAAAEAAADTLAQAVEALRHAR